jgi:transposase InsO family protein
MHGSVLPMREFLILAVHVLVTCARLLSPGGVRAVAAESLLLKHQLIISNRSRRRAPNLTSVDRAVLGLTTLWIRPGRRSKLGALVKPATLLKFHRALVDRKYRLLFSSSSHRRKPGPKGPSAELIAAIVEIKRRNPRFGCVRIAQQITRAFGVGIDVESHSLDGVSVCRMFNRASARQRLPRHASTDNDPLFRFHLWLANLRVREIEEIKTVPYAPVSHPFVERLIGTIRRAYLDQTLFWNAADLLRKLDEFRDYYNAHRVHRALDGTTPAQRAGALCPAPAALDHYGWQQHCRGLFEIPIAA